MGNKIRECVNEINRRKDASELLPEYVRQSMQLHDGYARIKLMLEYYIFYEVMSEELYPYMDMVKETLEDLNAIIGEVYSSGALTEENRKSSQKKLLDMRQDVIDHMQVLTGYVDCFVVYEYILNRIQYRFEERDPLPEDTEFAQRVMNFIFGSQDNVTINDNLRLVIGQLPMRMTRRHYFDLIRDCISVYKGSDVSSLEGFLYMFRTSAMLYHDPGQDKYFTEFAPVIKELAETDFENMDQQLYELYAEKIRVNASRLNELSDLYMQIGQLINETYTIVTAAPYCEEVEKMEAADCVVQGIHALFTGQDQAEVWQQTKEVLSTEEEKLDWLGTKLPLMEGKQEKLYDAVNVAEAALDELIQSRKDAIANLGLTEAFTYLHELSMLNSNSVFAPLVEEENTEKVTAELAEEVTEQLIGELKESFQGQSRMLRRAVMAGTVEKLPTFFTSAQEVADYIIQSLNQCDDEAEKYASKQLILELIG